MTLERRHLWYAAALAAAAWLAVRMLRPEMIAAASLSKAEARARLGLPADRTVLAVFSE